MDKLGLDGAERGERTTNLLQRRLRDGGWGLTPAAQTLSAAFLGSLATCHAEPAFVSYCGATPLPSTSTLHGWIDDSIQRVRRAAQGDEYQADIEPLLPYTAGDFFHFYSTTELSTTTTLQRSLNAKATSSNMKAAVRYMRDQSRRGDRFGWAHYKATSAKGVSDWKTSRPEGPELRLSDVEYAIAARLGLGLQPFPASAMTAVPEHCPLCTHSHTGAPVSLHGDSWHWLSCSSMKKGELSRRHDAVADAIGRVAWLVGAQVKREVEGLDPHSRQRPDIQVVFPGRIILTDVVVSNSLTPAHIAAWTSSAAIQQGRKNKKYASVAARVGAELLNVSVDACGGLASDAVLLVEAIGEEGERWSMGAWKSESIKRHLRGAVATAVQRGNAMAMLCGFTRATGVRSQLGKQPSAWDGHEDRIE